LVNLTAPVRRRGIPPPAEDLGKLSAPALRGGEHQDQLAAHIGVTDRARVERCPKAHVIAAMQHRHATAAADLQAPTVVRSDNPRVVDLVLLAKDLAQA
jgi:hypothetical protein